MAAPVKYQVFVSSTYDDLKEERDQVIRAVLEMGHIPVGMEMFSAADEEQWQIIARHIDESDYYAVIVAHRYGSVTPEGISYTRKEYEYALSKGIPCLGFLIDDSSAWPPDRMATTDAEKRKLEEFKELVRQKPVDFWKDGVELHSKFSISLMKSFTARPREGWVRAAEGPGPGAMAEVVRLSAENADLRHRLATAEGAAIQGHDDLVKETGRTLITAKQNFSYRYAGDRKWSIREVSLYDVFSVIAPEMIVEATVENLGSTLAMHIREDQSRQWDMVAINQVRLVLGDLMTLDLTCPSTRRHAVSDTQEYWTLTPLGLDVLKFSRRWALERGIAKQEDPDEEDAEGGVSSEEDAAESAISPTHSRSVGGAPDGGGDAEASPLP